jgi:hypothetical protein
MPTIETARLAIAPVAENHLELCIEEAFAWQEIIASTEQEQRKKRDDIRFSLAGRALYLVVFESTRSENADPEVIAALDEAAHQEALGSQALLHYYADTPDENGRARSWCLWVDDKSARQAVGGPAHQEAMSRAPEFYGENYAVRLFSVIPHDEGIIFYEHTHSPTKSTSSQERE